MPAKPQPWTELTQSAPIPFQSASLDIWDKKYRLKDMCGEPVDTSVDATYQRVAWALAEVEGEAKREHWYERFLWALRQGAIPAGRIVSNAGGQAYKPATSTINCTVSGTIHDSMDGILSKVHEAGLTLKAGCVAPGTWVYTEQGRVTAEQAVAEQHERMLCYDRDNARYEYQPIQRHLTTHVPRDEQIELVSNGASLKTSIKHPVLVYRNGRLIYVRADEVDESDALVHRSFPWRADGERVLEAWFAGAHLGDGSAYKRHKEYSPARSRWKERAEAWGSRLVFKIRAAEQAVVERYAAFFHSFCGAQVRAMPAETINGTPVWDYQVASFEASQAADLIDSQVGKKTAGLRVPVWIARHPEHHFLPFLAGLVDTDGTVSLERGSVTIATQSHDFAEEIRELLGLFGVHAGLTRCKPRAHNDAGHEVRDSGGTMLKISDSAFLLRVADHLADPGKCDRIHRFASQAGQYDRYVLPHSLKEALAKAADGLDHRQCQHLGFYHGYHRGDVVTRVWLDRWEAGFPELKPLIEFARTLRPLEDIRRNLDLPETFYDFEVAEHHNYVAGNGGLMVIHNCGIGYEFSTLRPKGAFVAGAGALTSGPLSFMDIFDRMCFTISSAGGRRGAQMATFDVGHPDVQDFIRAKREDGRLRQFNMSLLITHEFMEAVQRDGWWRLAFPLTHKQAEVEGIDLHDPDQVVWRDWPNKDGTDYLIGDDGRVACKVFKTLKARRLWNAIMSSTYDYAEPGFILIDQVNDLNNNWFDETIRATNPCVTGDTLLLTERGEVPIQDVVGESLEVWNGFEWSRVTPKVTGHDRNIVRIRFDNGEYLDCTLNHRFVLSDGRRVEARELSVGQELQGFTVPLAATGTDPGSVAVPVNGIKVAAKEALGVADTVYCVTEPKNHTAVFNGLMTANCGEQPLPPYGACWTGSMRLTTNHGVLRTDDAYDLVWQGADLKVTVDDEFTGSKTDLRPCTLVRNGTREVFEVRFDNGQRIELTGDHQVHTPNGWKQVDELDHGSEVHVQARERSDLDLVDPFYLGILKYLFQSYEGDKLVVTRQSCWALLRPILDRLQINFAEGPEGLAVSRWHPVMEEVERLDLENGPRSAVEGYVYAAKATAGRYKDKAAVYGDHATCQKVADALAGLGYRAKPPVRHRKERYRVLLPEGLDIQAPALEKSERDLDFAVYGWLLSDGWLTDTAGLPFSDQDDVAMEELAPHFQALTGTEGELRETYSGQLRSLYSLGCYRQAGIDGLKGQLGLEDYTSHTVRVPERIWLGSTDQQTSFLAAVFCADGSIDREKLNIRLVSASQEWLADIQLMLLNFGIHGRIQPSISKGNAFYTLALQHGDAYRFYRYIGFPYNAHKQAQLERLLRNKERWHGPETAHVARVDSIRPLGEQPVYDIEESSTHTLIVNGVVVHNCLLGSVNLTQFVREPFTEDVHFDWEQYREVVSVFTRMLDNVVAISGLPLDDQQHEIQRKRRHGMGFLGLGSTVAMLRMKYGDDDSVAFTERAARELAEAGWHTGVELAKEKGPAPIMEETYTVTEEMLRLRPEMADDGYTAGDQVAGKVLMARYSRYMQQFPEAITSAIAEHGARFTHHTSIAPTGTISLALANNASNGIEPSFAHKYYRNVIREGRKSKERVEVDSYELLAYRHHVDPHADPEAEGEHGLPDYLVDTNTIQPHHHVAIQAAAQKWIDSSISKTINVPQDFAFEDFKDIYLQAYDKGLKGCTTFRFNPEVFQGVLVQDKDLKSTTYRFELADGSVVEARGDEEIEYDGETHNAANLFDALKEGYYGRF